MDLLARAMANRFTGEKVFLLKGTNPVPNFNSKANTFTIYSDTIVIYRDTYYLTTSDTVIDCSIQGTQQNVKVVFDTDSKTFKVYYWRDKLKSSEIVVCMVKTQVYPYIFDASFQYTIDGVAYWAIPPIAKQVNVLVGGSNLPNFNSNTQKLVFPKNQSDYVLYIGEQYYTNIIPTTGMELDLTTATLSAISGTSAWVILLNLQDKTFAVRPWNETPNYKSTHVIFGTFRIDKTKNPYVYNFNLPFPFLVDGKLFGVSDGANATLNPLGATVKAIAHRGYSYEAPENTIPSFQLAKKKGFSYVETDVQWTSDGVPVILHDSTINRTARNDDGSAIETPNLSIGSLTLEQVKTYDFGIWKNPSYQGTRIPTFEEFILECKKLNLHPYIELKTDVTSDQAQILVDIVKKLGMINHVTWISFYLTALQKINDIVPTSRLGYLGDISDTFITTTLGLKTPDNDVFIDASSTSITKTLVENAQMQGIPVEAWTVDNANDVISLVEDGVSGITTNLLNIADIFKPV